MTDADRPERPIQVRVPILEDYFVLPIERLHVIRIDLVPFAALGASKPEENQRVGQFREEIHLAIPPGFALSSNAHTTTETEFARYQSNVKSENGQLQITRELQFKQAPTPALNRTELESFWKIVREDQQSAFQLRRIQRTDSSAWIRSVRPEQANSFGTLAYQQREYEAARQLFERAIEAHPDDAFAWNNLGRALAALGKLQEAQRAYEQQIVLSPKDAYAYNNLGLVQERMGHWETAVASLRKELEVHPGDSYATANLPRASIHARRWEEAAEAASNALRAQPNNAQQRLNLSIARVCQGKTENARQQIDAALGAQPSSALLNNAAYYLTECDQENDLAESYINRALAQAKSMGASSRSGTMSAAINSQNSFSTYLDTYGWLMFKESKIEQAIKVLSASIGLAPRAEVYAHLAVVEAKIGLDQEAVRHWREATFLEPGQIQKVPQLLVGRLEATKPLSLDRGWYPLPAEGAGKATPDFPTGQPLYFFVIANGDGSVESVRELDSDDPAAKTTLPAVRAIRFPVVQMDEAPLPTVHIVRLVKDGGGNVLVARSVGAEAVAIASERAPAEFPPPPPPAPPSPSSVPAPPAAGSTSNIGAGVTAPRVLRKIEPRYSEEARRSMLSGTVRVRCVVGADGKARQFQMERSLGLGLDENAILAVSAWQFEPGKKAGLPVDVFATVELNFRLVDEPNRVPWHVARVEFHQPEGSTRAVIEETTAPRVNGQADGATATVAFDISEKGSVSNVRVESTTDDQWGRDVSAALAKWKLTPAIKSGVPTVASCRIDFVRGN